MSIPIFFTELTAIPGAEFELDEVNSRHAIQVLRMKAGDELRVTDGKGAMMRTRVVEAHKKHCTVHVIVADTLPRLHPTLTIAISLIKNTSRFEWFIEKAAELGTAAIIPLIGERTEKLNVRTDRLVSISRSAMLQSEQAWLTNVHEPSKFAEIVSGAQQEQKLIAHCAAGNEEHLASVFNPNLPDHMLLIGPEGDFSPAEIELATAHGFTGVSLGKTRLRTETAGLFGAVICRGR
jgi:16S rRNA (uracil1498-N3)-methyltransferase